MNRATVGNEGSKLRALFFTSNLTPDYQCDLIHHGLETHPQVDLDVYPCPDYMYNDYSTPTELYGRGFTVFCNLDPTARNTPSRSDVKQNLRAGVYDFVVYGSIHRRQDLLRVVRQNVRPERIFFVDGEDRIGIQSRLIGKGHYFKRELVHPHPGVLPIQFAIPAEKITRDPIDLSKKTRLLAHCDPRDTTTYVYDTEQTYYDNYREACFAITMKKAGWDCMRHYEIVAQGCLPAFLDFDEIPPRAMVDWPRTLQHRANELYAMTAGDSTPWPSSQARLWTDTMHAFSTHLRERLTTRALADYLLLHLPPSRD